MKFKSEFQKGKNMFNCCDCLHYDVCLLHEDDFVSSAMKNGFCSKFKDRHKNIEFPCKVGDTVYVVAGCDNITKILDGTLWDEGGGLGTATGYYCPFEDVCEAEECDNTKKVFETTVLSIYSEYNENEETEGVWHIALEHYTPLVSVDDFGKIVFLNKKDAETALANENAET